MNKNYKILLVCDDKAIRSAYLKSLAHISRNVDLVYRVIDGRSSTSSSHGTREMPVWGYRFGPTPAFRYRKRILSVIDYLKGIQEK